MQGMSDDHFDKLFKDKFSGFEAEPSAGVWEGVSSKLQRKNDRKFPFLWVAAACLIALTFTFLWLLPSKEPIKLYGTRKPVLKEQTPQVAQDKLSTSSNSNPVKPSNDNKVIIQPEKTRSPVAATVPVTGKVKREYKEGLTFTRNETRDTLAVTIDRQRVVASLTETSIASADLSVLTDTPAPADAEEPRFKHKVKTVGDLVNFVVSKVDKRKNKIIEFSNGDEGDVVSGLNLGLLQYKTQNR